MAGGKAGDHGVTQKLGLATGVVSAAAGQREKSGPRSRDFVIGDGATAGAEGWGENLGLYLLPIYPPTTH